MRVNANPSVSHSLIHIIGHLLIPPVCCRSRSMSDASDLCNPIASGSIFEEIAYATFQRGQLLYLYHKGDEYRREDGSVVLQTKHPPQLRYRICGKTTLISWRNRLICFEPDRVVNANPSVSHSLIHIIGHLLIPPVCCRSRSMSDASDLCNPIASGSI